MAQPAAGQIAIAVRPWVTSPESGGQASLRKWPDYRTGHVFFGALPLAGRQIDRKCLRPCRRQSNFGAVLRSNAGGV